MRQMPKRVHTRWRRANEQRPLDVRRLLEKTIV